METSILSHTMKNIISTFIILLAVVKKGSAAQQASMIATLSIFGGIAAMVANFFTRFVLPDPYFGTTLVSLLILDTLFGAMKNIKRHTFDAWELFKGVGFKSIIALGTSAFAKTLLNIPEIISSVWATTTITYFLKMSVVLWLGMSFLGSIYQLTNKKFPPSFIMGRLTKFKKTGEVEHLVIKSEEEKLTKPEPESEPIIEDELNEAL